ncbi:MAG: hypothetical protein NTW96_27390 [Planctomycetia bacterium]|nr:hypothetical protein [Planctomycetia bacterium]
MAKLGELASVESGKPSYRAPHFPQRYHLVLRSAATILDEDGKELNETDTWSIVINAVHSAIVESGGRKPIDPQRFAHFANAIAAEYFRQPVRDFICVTTLSIKDLPVESIDITDCVVQKLSSRREEFRFPKVSNDFTADERFRKHHESTQYLRVVIEAKGHTAYEAINKALDALNLLRGLWTLCERLGRWSMHFGLHPHEPIGIVHLGPIHTVHHPDGSPAIDNYWYEPDYVGDRPLFEPKKGWKEIEEFRSWALEQMKGLSYKQQLQELLAQFTNALGQSDPNTAFLQLWCILERITDTVGRRYDETIERTLWSYVDRASMKEQLEHLRLRRNLYVHAAESGSEMEQTVHVAKSFAEKHLLRLIRNDFDVASIGEYGKFLSLPTDVGTLKKQRERLDRAIRIWDKNESSE